MSDPIGHMLLELEELEAVLEVGFLLSCQDKVLEQSPSKYAEFVVDLVACGVVGFTLHPKVVIGTFFVRKKKDRQRLVLDCRRTNALFRRAPAPDMGAAESLQRLEAPPGTPVYEASADIKNCFY